MPNQFQHACRDEDGTKNNRNEGGNATEQLYNQMDETALSIIGEGGVLKRPPGLTEQTEQFACDLSELERNDFGGEAKLSFAGNEASNAEEESYYQLDETALNMISAGGLLKRPPCFTEETEQLAYGLTESEKNVFEDKPKKTDAEGEYFPVEQMDIDNRERNLAALSYCHVLMFIPALFRKKSDYVDHHVTQSTALLVDALLFIVKLFLALMVLLGLVTLLRSVLSETNPRLALSISNTYIVIWVLCRILILIVLLKYYIVCIKCAWKAYSGIFTYHEKINFLRFWGYKK